MNIKFWKFIREIGVKDSYASWEISIVNTVNFINALAMLNLAVAIVFYLVIDAPFFIYSSLLLFFLASFVFVFNKIKNYLWASYYFFSLGFLYFIVMNLYLGKDTYIILLYFPMCIAILQIFGNKYMFKHMIVLFSICVLSILAIIYGFINYPPSIVIEPYLNAIQCLNLIISFTTTISFMISISIVSNRQLVIINDTLNEKAALLAELNHRVKNNLNIIVSLLNMRRHQANHQEAKQALLDCQNKVYSMALVHNMLYTEEDHRNLNFNQYIEILTKELVNSLNYKGQVKEILDLEPLILNLDKSIPCGLILNELIVNSIKHAKVDKNKDLLLTIKLFQKQGKAHIYYKDNGEAFDKDILFNNERLGMQLIDSLVQQIDGSYHVSTLNGMEITFIVNL